MDNNAQQSTSSASGGQSGDQQVTNDHVVVHAAPVMPTPNRGGIPVSPVAPVVYTQPVDKPSSEELKPQAAPQSVSPQPVSIPGSREHEPIAQSFPDIVKMTDVEAQKEEVEITGEIEGMVEETPDSEKPKIDQELKEAGVEHAKENTPMPPIQIGVKPLPMSFAEAQFIRKKHKWKDSVSWLTDLIVYHWKKIKALNNKEEI